jgi:hypothetical protein
VRKRNICLIQYSVEQRHPTIKPENFGHTFASIADHRTEDHSNSFLYLWTFDTVLLISWQLLPLSVLYSSLGLLWFQTSAAMFTRSALFWDITLRRVVIVYRRFGTTYRSHLTCQDFHSWPVKMGPIRFPETSVNNYHTTQRNIPEERISHQHRDGSPTSRSSFQFSPHDTL